MSDSVRPHRQKPTRLPRPWDSPGKNTEVGCHFLLQCMKVKSESEVAQSCLTLSDPMDCSPPGPWDFPDKSTGVGCHCLLWRRQVGECSKVTGQEKTPSPHPIPFFPHRRVTPEEVTGHLVVPTRWILLMVIRELMPTYIWAEESNELVPWRRGEGWRREKVPALLMTSILLLLSFSC